MNVCPIHVGRERELAVLTDALERGGLVLVAGEAGIGKSRLLREFATLASADAHPVVWGRPEVVTAPGPYSVVVDLLDDLASILRKGAPAARELADSLAGSVAGGEPPARQIAARLRALFGNLAQRPVIVIEDLHASDELSQAVVAHLARSAPDDGVLLIASYRPEDARAESMARLLDVLHRDHIATQLDLEPLDADALHAMLEAMWGAAPTDNETEAIARLGEGIPFFIEELAGARGDDDGALPVSITRAVEGRLARLEPEAQAVIRVASLMGGALDPSVIAVVCALDEAVIPRHLIAGVGAGLLTDREGRLVFRHDLVRASVADAIVSVERAEVHAAIAAAIQARHASAIEPHATALARHHTEAGRADVAAQWWVIAGRRALAAAALEEASRAFAAARAGAVGDGVLEAMQGEAELKVRLVEWDQAMALFGEIAAAHRAAGDRERAADALSWKARVMLMEQDASAIAVLDEALALVEDEPDSHLYARLVIERGHALTRVLEDPIAGEPVLVEGLRRAEKVGDVALRAQALEGLAWVAELQGRATDARRLGDEACAIAAASGNDELIGKAYTDQALRLALRGLCSEGLAHLDTARTHLAKGFGGPSLGTLDHLRAWILWRMGMPAEAERFAARLETTRWARVYGRTVRAWAAVERGAVDTARAITAGWWDDLGGSDAREAALGSLGSAQGPSAESALALLADLVASVATGEVDEETLTATQGYARMCAPGNGDIASLTAIMHARAMVNAGRSDDAEAVLDQIEPTAAQYPLHAASLLEVRGLARTDAAILQEAAEAYERAENVSDRARCLRALGILLADAGETDRGIAALKQALTLAMAGGAVAEANRCESALRDRGVRPRAGRPKGSTKRRRELTGREEEIVALLSAGATNNEIAARLFLSERTVEDHISNALRRLGLPGRPALVAWAVKQGLV